MDPRLAERPPRVAAGVDLALHVGPDPSDHVQALVAGDAHEPLDVVEALVSSAPPPGCSFSTWRAIIVPLLAPPACQRASRGSTAANHPERMPGFDDSSWKRLDRVTTHNQMQPNTSPVLYADDNGVPGSGFVWYRGRYSGRAGRLCLEGRHRYHAWVNGRSLGTVTSDAEVPGPMGLGGLGASPPVNQPVTLDLPADAQGDGENVLAVLVESWGHNMDAGGAIQAKNPRGLISASLADRPGAPPCGFTFGTGGEVSAPLAAGTYSTTPGLPRPSGGIDWRIHGARPADYPNTSGLFGEAQGWHRPGDGDGGWAPVSLPRATSSGPELELERQPLAVARSVKACRRP
ncbi:MAG TPA: beta galactosidase jelly roll domain-containing protein [Thermoleophilaceae bacterium]